MCRQMSCTFQALYEEIDVGSHKSFEFYWWIKSGLKFILYVVYRVANDPYHYITLAIFNIQNSIVQN